MKKLLSYVLFFCMLITLAPVTRAAFKDVYIPTFVLSNEENGLIDNLIAAGYGDDTLYEVMQVLQPISGGAIPADFIAALAACPADCDAKSYDLSIFADPENNPICLGSDGSLHVASIYGRNYYGETGYITTAASLAGTENMLFTTAQSGAYYIDSGSVGEGDGSYQVFAIAWSPGKSSPWAKPWLVRAESYKLMPNCLKGTDMTQPITRAEFAALSVKLYEALSGQAALPAQSNPFTDTTDPDILKAVKIGITNGTSPTTFSPKDLITREQTATMLTRAYKAVFWEGWTLTGDATYTAHSLDFSGVATFADDSSISAYAKPSVYFMVKNGIINGVGNNMFAPNTSNIPANAAANYGQATREVAVKISVATLENLGNT